MNSTERKFDPLKALNLKSVRNRMAGRGGRKVHVDTLRKYIVSGCKLPGGEVVRLKAVKWAGEWLLMDGWLEDFQAARLLGGMAT